MTHFRAIMDRNISELEDACNEPLAPDPLNNTQEANIMLPENRPQDQSNFTTTTEDEKTCLKCRHLGAVPSESDPTEPEPFCDKWDDISPILTAPDYWETHCPKHCGSFEAIASVGGAA
jgi:hypothetical protein